MFANVATVQLLIFVTLTGFRECEAVMCTYQMSEDNFYYCNLINQTILTDSDMDTETGTHVPGFSNEAVTLLLAGGQSVVEIFPSTLINRFINLKTVVLIAVGMKAFTNPILSCQTLSAVILMSNQISSVPRNIFQNCDQLTDLYLDSNRINLIDVAAFSGLTQLKRLSLTNNEISYVDPFIFDSTRNMEILNLDGNSIRDVSPRTFELLPLLTNLTLNGNSITTWSSTFHEKNQALQELRLDRNEIATLSGDLFFNLPHLKVLRVGDLIDELPTFIGLSSLEELWLGDNKLKMVSANAFRNLVNLRKLVLSYNDIESVNFTQTSTNSTDWLLNLETLDLTLNKLSSIPNGTFTMLGNLTELSLRGNKITLLTAESIRPIAQLRRLDVSYNQITRIEKDFFSGVTNLTFLSLGNVCFNNEIDIESSDDFENRVAALLEPCFNLSSSVKTNISLLAGMLLLASKWII